MPSHVRKGERDCSAQFWRGTNSIHEAQLLWPKHLPKTPSPNIITLGSYHLNLWIWGWYKHSAPNTSSWSFETLTMLYIEQVLNTWLIQIRYCYSRFDAWDRVLRAGVLEWPWGMGWRGRWEGGSGWETHVHPWLIYVNIWQKPPQYCKVISLQLKLKKILTRKMNNTLLYIWNIYKSRS